MEKGKKLTINLTPKIAITLQPDEKAINRITLDDKGISYMYNYDYTDVFPIRDSESTILGEYKYRNKRREIGKIRRDHITSVTRSSHVNVVPSDTNTSKVDTEIEHVLMIESINSNIAMTCTFDELKKYYPIIEDYYEGGNRWESETEENLNNKQES